MGHPSSQGLLDDIDGGGYVEYARQDAAADEDVKSFVGLICEPHPRTEGSLNVNVIDARKSTMQGRMLQKLSRGRNAAPSGRVTRSPRRYMDGAPQ